MQYKALSILALSAGALAAPEKRQLPAGESYNTLSVLSVLETALPTSLLAAAITNSASVYSEIASEFAAGSTPSWFTGLPSDVQSLFVPAVTNSASLSAAGSNITSAVGTAAIVTITANSTGVISGNGTAIVVSGNSTVISNGTASHSASGSSSGSASTTGTSHTSTGTSGRTTSAGSSTSSSASSSGGASLPTAVYGMSLAGAVGLVGLFAL